MKSIFAAILVLSLLNSQAAVAESGMSPSDSWLPSLITATPEEGFALAVTLSRKGVTTTQPDIDKLKVMRQKYAHDPDSLMGASHVIAIHFRTIAEANNYWRARE